MDEKRPYPDSLCHQCAAPPRYIEAKRATYILCPLLERRYPEQPVRSCELFRPRVSE
ncbi:MAG: hypothetical protein AAFX94_12545 [Myxococcota bacterium]